MPSDNDHTYQANKRKKRIITDSDSSDDSVIAHTRRKKKTYRVVSDGESSDEDSDVPRPVVRRQNYRVVSEDESNSGSSASRASGSVHFEDTSTSSEWQSDWSSSDELDRSNDRRSSKSKAAAKSKPKKPDENLLPPESPVDIDSDNSDDQVEKCPICLLPFRKQQLATPASCEHCFCLECLIEWSKNINTCPVDRQTFTIIHVRNKHDGKVIKHLPVEVIPRVEEHVQEDPTFCEVCHQSDREDRMLLCDGCDSGYHLECLTPPMNEVPMEEWYCPECSQNNQNDAETIEIDLDEVPDLMEEARRLGVSYGRTRTGVSYENSPAYPRIIPRTRQAERVRANIRNRAREFHDNSLSEQLFDPNQPSTSSGIESMGDNSRSRSPNNSSNSYKRKATTTRSKAKSKTKTKTAKRKARKRSKASSSNGTLVREVRITEVNEDGEEEEIVTSVRVASPTARVKTKKRSKKSRKRRKRARTVSSVLASNRTVKRRLASTLGMCKPIKGVPLLVPSVKDRITTSDKSMLIHSRYSSGIAQVSLFGDRLGLDYSPPGSDDEHECPIGNGLMISTQRRSVLASARRLTALKGIANPINDVEDSADAIDLLGSIINSQEFWHSKRKSEVTLKADGTLFVNSKKENKHSINNNESPKKEKAEVQQKEEVIANTETPLDLSNVNPNDITQAPMYNNPCGGGNRGNFRGGYRDNGRHSHGGHNYGSRESGGGRHSYGGSGPRDNFGNRDFRPPFFNPNFEPCGPPMFGANPPFRNRNPQHFRNERFGNRFPTPERPPFFPDSFERPPFAPHERFMRPRGPPPMAGPPGPSQGPQVAQVAQVPQVAQGSQGPQGPQVPPPPLNLGAVGIRPPHIQAGMPPNLVEDSTRTFLETEPFNQPVSDLVPTPVVRQDNEDCDIYCDIDTAAKSDYDAQDDCQNGSMALLPPPEPPSGLLDFEENSKSDKDNDSDQELVIDDSHKDDSMKELQSGDKYDPFTADSDSNDTNHGKDGDKARNSIDNCSIPIPLDPPPVPPTFPAANLCQGPQPMVQQDPANIRLTAYDDDDEEDSQADCPNFSVYSSLTMDVARHTEQELSQQIGPLEPPPLPPNIPDDDDIIVGDVQACDLADIPEPSDPYVEALQKERRTLSKIPPKKISHDCRGKITFKIGNKLKLNNKLTNLYEDLDEDVHPTPEPAEAKSSSEKQADEKEKLLKSQKEAEKEAEKEKKEREEPSMEVEEKKSRQEKDDSMQAETEDLRKESQLKKDEQRTDNDLPEESDNSKNRLTQDTETIEISGDESSTFLEKDCRENKRRDSPQPVIDITEKSSDTILSISDTIQSSPKKVDSNELSMECNPEDLDDGEVNKSGSWTSSLKKDGWNNSQDKCKGFNLSDSLSKQKLSSDGSPILVDDNSRNLPDDQDDDSCRRKSNSEDDLSDTRKKSSHGYQTDEEEVEHFPIAKDKSDIRDRSDENLAREQWDSDGAYTPCKDELPVKDDSGQNETLLPYESGLEPITPTKDKINDDLDGCRTPVGYAGLGTEAISETDEAMNFEDELNLLSLRKEKEMEDGEIVEENKVVAKEGEKSADEKEDETKKKKKKDKKDKSKETEKNKENIASENQVAWKKLSKSTKERPYRDKDKRSRSKEKEKEKDKDKDKDKEKEKDKEKDKDKDKYKKRPKEVAKKKEKRKELPRYDVRKIIAEKPARPRKDEYGRDIREKSRSRSRSRSLSSKMSLSRDRRSRSYSRGRSRSRSRFRLNRSWSRDRRSRSKSCRSLSRKRSLSRSRRKSPRKRSVSRRRSLSRKRSISRRRSRSLSRKRRSLSPRRRSRRRSLSRSRGRRKDKTKKYKSRSRSRNRKRSRSKSPKRASSKSREKKHAKRKLVSRSRSKGRSLSRERDRNRNWDQINEKSVEHNQHFSREREDRESWSAQWTPSWSRSRSKSPVRNQPEPIASREWSPPPVLDSVAAPPKNLTVILTNKEAIKKKKKERRKESKKSKETEKRRKTKRNRTPPPSKEVFASGDNILVSVCFNKDNEATNPPGAPEIPETIPLIPPVKRRRRDSMPSEAPKRSKKDKTKEKRSKSPKTKKEKKKKSKAAEIAATKKPVAVIDLDQSPFREQTPSPRDVIVLSDDDDKQVQELATPEQCPPSQASPPREQFVSQGPKTPPEPQIKFSITKQTNNLRPSMMNPLLEEEEEEMDERADEELEMRAQEELELRLKIGPNTPPEPPSSPPTSPDAYDPFDPTKSRSPTPDASQEATPNDERDRNQRNSPRKHEPADATLLPDEPPAQPDQSSQDKQLEKPKIISMVTIKRAASPKRDASPVIENEKDTIQSCNSPPKAQQSQQSAQSTANPFATINPVLATVAAAVQRSTVFNASTPNTTQRNLLQSNRISPSNQMKQRANDRPQLPNLFTNSTKSTMARASKSAQNKNSSTMGQNGNDAAIEMTNDNVDMSSPYSPGSTLSDGMFDPPSPANYNSSPPANVTGSGKPNAAKSAKTADKKDAFDALFGMMPANKTAAGKGRSKKANDKDKKKKATNPKVGVRMDENQLQILDDLPSSAVEMQVKDKFLKKLNRQERVVEEVKLVLKPHYTKKHVTKEEYKDIMRKAVPKICHNKTGEINPKKIAHLIEAYVRKCRNSKKKPPTAGGASTAAAKTTKPAKTLWS